MKLIVYFMGGKIETYENVRSITRQIDHENFIIKFWRAADEIIEAEVIKMELIL